MLFRVPYTLLVIIIFIITVNIKIIVVIIVASVIITFIIIAYLSEVAPSSYHMLASIASFFFAGS